MKRLMLLTLLAVSSHSAFSAGRIALTCIEFVVLTETAVRHRDTKIGKAHAKSYLAEDEYFTKVEKVRVQRMVDQVYSSAKGKSEFASIVCKECLRHSMK